MFVEFVGVRFLCVCPVIDRGFRHMISGLLTKGEVKISEKLFLRITNSQKKII